MKKRKFLKPEGDYIYFEDLLNPENIYCVTREEFNKIDESIREYGFKTRNAPDGLNAKAYPLELVEEKENWDEYDIVSKEPTDFSINRIQWILVEMNGGK